MHKNKQKKSKEPKYPYYTVQIGMPMTKNALRRSKQEREHILQNHANNKELVKYEQIFTVIELQSKKVNHQVKVELIQMYIRRNGIQNTAYLYKRFV